MALEHAILVSLVEQPATGYELARRFDASIGYFWSASHQQIYRTLTRMETDGWIHGTVHPQAGKPDKKTYAVTDVGRAKLGQWSRQPTAREPLRSDFAVKLRGFASAESIARDTRVRRAEHVDRLDRYRASEAKHFAEPSQLRGAELGQWLALRGGISVEESSIAWCDEILAALEPLDGVTDANEGPGPR